MKVSSKLWVFLVLIIPAGLILGTPHEVRGTGTDLPPLESVKLPIKEADRRSSRIPLPPPENETLASKGGRIALTFNDGPDDRIFPVILQRLDDAGVRATFFVIGRSAQDHPKLIRQAVKAGHQIENHSYSHRSGANGSSSPIREEILAGARAIKVITGKDTKFFRPPLGEFDDRTVRESRRAGHRVILWSNIGAGDEPFPGEELLIGRIKRTLFDGAVIMLHATNARTVGLLPELVNEIRSEGYRLVTLDELLAGIVSVRHTALSE